MTSDERELRHLVDRYLPAPSHMEFVAARDRVLHELRAVPPHLQKPRLADAPPAVSWLRTAVPLAAAAALIATVATVSFQRGDWIATVHAADGSTYTLKPNEVLRASAAGTMLTLRDGSSVEMRAASELSVERAADGLDIRLRGGDIIVTAAGRRDGHLSVRTKDMTVAIDGTVFLTIAGQQGSRVGVIEGEVHVRERTTPLRRSGRPGAVERRLRPGEQMATSPTIAQRPLAEDITWSRHANAHLAVLDAFTRGMARTAGTRQPMRNTAQAAGVAAEKAATPRFEEASVRACDPDNLPTLPGARGGGANSFYMTPGRTYALCMTPAALIRTAYGYGPGEFPRFAGEQRGLVAGRVYGLGSELNAVRVRGGPDWVRSERYTIEAVAVDAADSAVMQGPMLRALLEDRFRLKAHIETEEVPEYNLVVAPGGLKIQAVGRTASGPAGTGACEAGPPPTPGAPPVFLSQSADEVRQGAKPGCGISIRTKGLNQVVIAGAQPLSALGDSLSGSLGNARVIDKTGLTDLFNFVFEFAWDAEAGGIVSHEPVAPVGAPRASAVFSAIEEQLGLRLVPVHGAREFVVIDSIERPGPN